MMIFPQADFARSTPEAQGIRSEAIDAMLRDIRDTGADVHSLLILRHGHLVFEHYFAPYTAETRHSIFSCSKTFTSMLIGIAQDKGLINVHDHVLDYFPDVEIAKVNDNLRAMTIHDLLIMGSGHAQDTFGTMLETENDPDADWVKIFLNRPVDEEPGTHFVYNTGATYMLSAILTRVTGKSALTLANEWLFREMGIENAEWNTCPRGINQGGTGLRLRPRDLMRMGILLLERGRWGNKQLVSSAYIAEAQRAHIDNANPNDPNQDPNWAAGYGYQVWCNTFGGYRADGMGGQYIVVLPHYDMVVVYTDALGGDITTGYPLDLISKYLLPATFNQSQCYDRMAAKALAQTAQTLSSPVQASMPEAAKAFPFGFSIDTPENAMKICHIEIFRTFVNIVLAREPKNESVVVPFAWNAPVLSPEPNCAPAGWTHYAPTAATASWKDDALHIRINYVGEPLTLELICKPEGNTMTLTIKSTLAGSFSTTAPLA